VINFIVLILSRLIDKHSIQIVLFIVIWMEFGWAKNPTEKF